MSNIVDSKYRKVLVATQRAKQLQRGARPRVDMPGAKPIRIAIEEVECGLIHFELTPLRARDEMGRILEPVTA